MALPRPASTLIREGSHRLRAAGMEHARYEAEWLLGRLLDTKPLEMYLRQPPIPADVAERFLSQIDARCAGTPLQYLLGEADFFGRSFAVAPGVFIPRPETEAVVAQALAALRAMGRPRRLLDLGAGSGCIAVTLACELPACVVIGVELSWEALRCARRNALRHGVADRVRLIQGDWTAPAGGAFDGIVSNPPYIPSGQVDRLPLDVRQEPRLSLDGGPDGLRDLLAVLREAERLLAPEGLLALECGEEQVGLLLDAAARAAWVQKVLPLQDLAGRPRGVLLTRT
jgi:release factor glutamine methyltransferase